MSGSATLPCSQSDHDPPPRASRHPLVPASITMPQDKLLHFALGVIACLAACVGAYIYGAVGLGALLAYTTTMIGVLYEGQQWIRKEGQVEWLDALATAAPGWLVWGLLILL